MKNKKYLILSIISFVLGGGSFAIVVLFGLFGTFMCGKPFYMISGSNGPIPACASIFNTDFIWVILISVILLIAGITLMVVYKKGVKK